MTEPDNPQPDVEVADCDDYPKLTAEEWAAVAKLSALQDEPEADQPGDNG